jgi:cytochrome c5
MNTECVFQLTCRTCHCRVELPAPTTERQKRNWPRCGIGLDIDWRPEAIDVVINLVREREEKQRAA